MAPSFNRLEASMMDIVVEDMSCGHYTPRPA